MSVSSAFQGSPVALAEASPKQPAKAVSGEETAVGTGSNPYRHPLAWQDPEFLREERIEREMRRVFDVCHGCRRCFNLCEAFPTLFKLIDQAPSEDLDTVPSPAFKSVVDECTLCDMCFLTKCPYVPPHSLNLDLPHLIVRYRAAENRKKNGGGAQSAKPEKSDDKKLPPRAWEGVADANINTAVETQQGVHRTLSMKPSGLADRLMIETDLRSKVATRVPGVAKWMNSKENKISRSLLESVAGVSREASIPNYVSSRDTFCASAAREPPVVNELAPAFSRKRKVLIYATCLVNWNDPSIGIASRALLAHNGVESKVLYPRCCGMPKFEQGLLKEVAVDAAKTAKELAGAIREGYTIVSLVPSCLLMLKQEWLSLLPENEDVKLVSQHTLDISEYMVSLSKEEGLMPAEEDIFQGGGITLHQACHSRAQNMGNKALELLRKIPKLQVLPVEKCSGHGGSWGVKKEHHETALKVGTPLFRQAAANLTREKKPHKFVASECPLAATHIRDGMQSRHGEAKAVQALRKVYHPIELFAAASGCYNLETGRAV